MEKISKDSNFCCSDGGKKESIYKDETNDCTVRAMVHCTGISYEECHKIAEESGRLPKKGHNLRSYMMMMRKQHPEIVFEPITNKVNVVINGCHSTLNYTTNKFLKDEKFKKGTYLLRKNAHVFVVKDGIVFDTWFQKQCQILDIWKVSNTRSID